MASSPRMTKDLVAEIVKNVLKATNLDAEREAIVKATKERVRALLVAQLPVQFVQLVAQHPREWFAWQDEVYIQNADCSPLALMASATGEESRRSWYYLPVEPSVPSRGGTTLSLKAREDLADLIEQANAWAKKRTQAADELRAFLLSCSTVAKAIERMPEIEKHIPRGSKASYDIVAPSNALAALSVLGFDTTAAA